MSWKTLTFVASVTLLAGCGISDGTLLSDLDADDLQKLCEETPEESFTCTGEGFEYTITFGDCDTSDTDGGGDVTWPASCTATVGDLRDCNEAYIEALRADPCTADVPAACDWMADCV